MIAPYRIDVPAAAALQSTSATTNVYGPTGLLVLAAAAANTWLLRFDTAGLVAGQHVVVRLTLTVPADKTGATYRSAGDVIANGVGVGGGTAAAVYVAPGQTVTLDASFVVPAGVTGTASIQHYLYLASGAASAREVVVSCQFITTAYADELVSMTVERDTRRTADTNATGGLVLTGATPGPRSGQLVYLCSSWSVVAALDALYRTGRVSLDAIGTVTPTYLHYSTGTIRATTERAIPGRATRWLVTVPTKETT